MSKTLSEIIEAAKDNRRMELDYDDLFYGLLALSYLHAFDSQDMLNIVDAQPGRLKVLQDESWRRNKQALATPPKDYLGETWDPASSHYQLQRASMKRLLDKIIDDKIQNIQTCPACNGTKKLLQLFEGNEVECPVCNGEGKIKSGN